MTPDSNELHQRALFCIEQARLTDGNECAIWTLEAIAISLYHIAAAIEKIADNNDKKMEE